MRLTLRSPRRQTERLRETANEVDDDIAERA